MCVSLQQLGHVITVNVGNRNISPCPHPLVNYLVRLTFCAFLWLTSLTFPLIKHHNCNFNWVFAVLPTAVTVDEELNKCTYYHHHNGQTFGPSQRAIHFCQTLVQQQLKVLNLKFQTKLLKKAPAKKTHWLRLKA